MSDLFEQPELIPFQEVLEALLDADQPLAPRYLYRLTDLGRQEQGQLAAIWPQLPAWRRTALLQDLEEIFEGDTLLSFEAVSRLALQDPQAEIRFLGIRALQEYEVPDLIEPFIEFMRSDPDEAVRAVAASALGKYVYLGEIEELPRQVLKRIEDTLLEVLASQAPDSVRRRALESLGFSSRPEVPAYIDQAFNLHKHDWLGSALFAMGRSYDQRWREMVIEMLDHSNPAVRMEAARAAGELELSQALQYLIELTEDGDEDVRLAAVWSLSQIGGDKANRVLNHLLKAAENDEETEFIAAALDNLVFNESIGLHGMLDFGEQAELDSDSDFDSYDDDDFDDDINDDFDDDFDDDDDDDEWRPIDFDAFDDEDADD
ncbi:MAG: HEAT repeat domain-containing protein [Anaerolineales bacterium]|nr:HEAT repeat domain-containing protein [Anaerolineales bacterium]